MGGDNQSIFRKNVCQSIEKRPSSVNFLTVRAQALRFIIKGGAAEAAEGGGFGR